MYVDDLEFDELRKVEHDFSTPRVNSSYWSEAKELLYKHLCDNMNGTQFMKCYRGGFEPFSYIRNFLPWYADTPVYFRPGDLHLPRAQLRYQLSKLYLVGEELVTRNGKIAKRIRKWVHERFDYDLPTNIVATLGELAHRMSIKPGEYYFDVTRDFGWRDGDFGDSGSCFWGSNSGAKELIHDANGFALRIFSEPDTLNNRVWYNGKVTGVARCWAVPLGQWQVVLFNCYSDDKNIRIEDMANLLATYLGEHEVQHVSLYNYDDTSGLLYINGGSGIVVAPNGSDIDDPIDLELGDDLNAYCYRCEDRYNVEDLYYSEYLDEYLCPECYDQEHMRCTNCNNVFHEDQGMRSDDGDFYCERCYNENFFRCESCYHETPIDDMHENQHGEWLCGNCHDAETYGRCHGCSRAFHGEHVGQYCRVCQARAGQRRLGI
jgi:hypothetical protein